jgi:potassium/chloride transporter 4/5/6
MRLFSPLFLRKQHVKEKSSGFGTFFGVYLPGTLSLFGVIMYLRFGSIIGNLGLLPTVAVVSLSCLIVLVTVLSMSSAATNAPVGGGGTYYMISRSLGIEIGSAVGVPLLIAQSLSVSFCSIGFAESIQPFFPTVPIAYLGASSLLTLMGCVYFSASIALKAQLGIFLVIVGSLISLFMGKAIPADPAVEALNGGLTFPFWVGFALFFPAMTGIESGVSMSGNLHSPKKSLPLGTIAALVTGFVVYVAMPFFLLGKAPRDALISDVLILQRIAKFQGLIIAGIWAATLSSVLNGLLAAPRTLQALALDGVFPRFMAKEWGRNKEPRIATLLCFAIAVLGIFYGSIDKIAPILTMFYLIAYATLNLATGLEDLIGNPSWRPTIRIPWFISISGVIFCLLAMFMIDSGATIIALLCVVAIYLLMRQRNFTKKWEDIQQGILVFLSRFAIYRLADLGISTRSWRPHFLVFSENPMQVTHLVNVASVISQNKGFLILASVFSRDVMDYERAERWKKMVGTHLKGSKIEALVEFCIDDTLLSGAKMLLANYGMGSLSPNTLMLGELKNSDLIKDYLGVIQAACRSRKNVVIVRDKPQAASLFNTISIWWDESSRSNSELMLILGHMLASSKSYRKSRIYLESVVSSESGKVQRLEYFRDFFAKRRFSVTPRIYVKEKALSSRELIGNASASADAVLIGMRPFGENESVDEFETYYRDRVMETRGIPNAVFVICSERLDKGRILA